MNQNIDEVISELQTTTDWHPILLAAHNAMITMGTFQRPLDYSLLDLTFGQWQLETARRISVAVLKAAQ